MTCSCRKPDRYISFEGIDCDGNARRLMGMIETHLAYPERRNAFWDYFERKRRPASGPWPDDLFLIHSNINQVRELFETWADAPALALLEQIEEECC